MRLATTLLLCSSLFLAACATTAVYNPTTFPFEIDEQRIAQQNIRTVVIPHVNLGQPSRSYLDKEAARIDGTIAAYLKKAGLKVVPQREFEQRWNAAERAFGNPVDPTTGKVNMRTFSQIMEQVRDQMRDDFQLDAFVFTDLLELEVPFNGGLKHLGRWDGVTRKPSLQGPGNSVTADFDWNQSVAVASLQVAIFDRELQRVFFSRGGLEATEAIDTRSSSGRYTRRRSMLENREQVAEGIRLAFHPFIEMKDWPGNP